MTLFLLVATISTSISFLLWAMPDIPVYGYIAGPAFAFLAFVWYFTFISDKDLDGDGVPDTPSQKRLALFFLILCAFTDAVLTLSEIFRGSLSLFREMPVASLNDVANWGGLVAPVTLAWTGIVLVANLLGFMAYGIVDDIFEGDVLALQKKGKGRTQPGGGRPAFVPQPPRMPQQPQQPQQPQGGNPPNFRPQGGQPQGGGQRPSGPDPQMPPRPQPQPQQGGGKRPDDTAPTPPVRPPAPDGLRIYEDFLNTEPLRLAS
jgi:hypothetical protein